MATEELSPETTLWRGRLQNRLALLRQLEASLCASHRALVSLDLAAIQEGTREQRRLARNLASEIRRRSAPSAAAGMERERISRAGDMEPLAELAKELRRTEWKVLDAARVQAALVKRAQRKLAVMANMLAGAHRNYGSPAAAFAPAMERRS